MLSTLEANELCLLGMLLEEPKWEVFEDIPSGLKRTSWIEFDLYHEKDTT